MPVLVDRRRFLARSLTTSAFVTATGPGLFAGGLLVKPRPRVAAIYTVLRFRSHAFNILENFVLPYHFRGELVDPGVELVSLYADQSPDDDMTADLSARFRIPVFKSIDQALCVGGRTLAVDAVLAIGEHGDYPFNERAQQLYPRKEFFDQSVAVMRRAGHYVPYFNDKHFSHSWDSAKQMVDMARTARMPIMGGSSVPLAQRKPMLELPENAVIEEAVAVHGGGLESYDFHGLEMLQSIVEARRGGETGIASIELVFGEAFEKARQAGRWSQDLVDAAMTAEKNLGVTRQQRPPAVGVFAKKEPAPKHSVPQRPDGPHAILVTYRDGLRATVLKMGSDADRWDFACRLRGEREPRATAFFNSPWGNRGLFKALSHAAQHMFVHGQEPYPAERTLLTTGALEAAMRSYEQGGKPLDTPHLAIAYQPRDWRAFRENGDSWKVITADTPQPLQIEPASK